MRGLCGRPTKREKLGDPLIMQPTNFELVINLKAVGIPNSAFGTFFARPRIKPRGMRSLTLPGRRAGAQSLAPSESFLQLWINGQCALEVGERALAVALSFESRSANG